MAGNVNVNVSSSGFCQACGATNPAQATYCLACREPLSTVFGGTDASTNPLTGLHLPGVIIQQRYRILDVLSTGTVSTIYKIEDMQLGNRVVTLKEIGKHNQNTQEALASIEADKREMLLLASLIHPNLPRIYDYFVENHHWYFVMDFFAGETLEEYLSKRKYRPLPVEEVLDSGLQLSAVLDYLHIQQSPLDLNALTLRKIWVLGHIKCACLLKRLCDLMVRQWRTFCSRIPAVKPMSVTWRHSPSIFLLFLDSH